MFRKISFIVALISVLLLLALPALADISIDFESDTVGTAASSLSHTGVSFGGAGWLILNPGPNGTGNELGSPGCGAPLTVSFSTVQNHVGFIWSAQGNTLKVDVYLGGSVVATENFAGGFGSSASISHELDGLVIDAGNGSGCVVIDNFSATSSPSSGSSDAVFHFADGRINDMDTGSPIVLYPVDYGSDQTGLHIYAADRTQLLLAVTPDMIATAGCTDSNTTIVQDSATGIIVSRLAMQSDGTCPFQINAPAMEPGVYYVVIFDGLQAPTHYESHEEHIG